MWDSNLTSTPVSLKHIVSYFSFRTTVDVTRKSLVRSVHELLHPQENQSSRSVSTTNSKNVSNLQRELYIVLFLYLYMNTSFSTTNMEFFEHGVGILRSEFDVGIMEPLVYAALKRSFCLEDSYTDIPRFVWRTVPDEPRIHVPIFCGTYHRIISLFDKPCLVSNLRLT